MRSSVSVTPPPTSRPSRDRSAAERERGLPAMRSRGSPLPGSGAMPTASTAGSVPATAAGGSCPCAPACPARRATVPRMKTVTPDRTASQRPPSVRMSRRGAPMPLPLFVAIRSECRGKPWGAMRSNPVGTIAPAPACADRTVAWEPRRRATRRARRHRPSSCAPRRRPRRMRESLSPRFRLLRRRRRCRRRGASRRLRSSHWRPRSQLASVLPRISALCTARVPPFGEASFIATVMLRIRLLTLCTVVSSASSAPSSAAASEAHVAQVRSDGPDWRRSRSGAVSTTSNRPESRSAARSCSPISASRRCWSSRTPSPEVSYSSGSNTATRSPAVAAAVADSRRHATAATKPDARNVERIVPSLLRAAPAV